jgi:hypothetical protein
MKSRYLPWLVVALLCAFGIIRIALILPARSHENDFAHYYVTSRLWVEGRDPYRTPFAPEFAKYGFQYDPRIPTGTNPPALVALFAPIALLPPGAAFVAWVAIEILSLALTLAMIVALLRRRVAARMLAILVGLLVASSTLYFHFYFSQVQLVLGALLLGAYVLQRSGRYSSALALVAASALLKFFPAALLPWFVLTAPGSLKARIARTRPALALIALVVLCTWRLWPGFLHAGGAVVGDAVVNQTFNFSLPSLIVNIGVAGRAFAITSADLATIWRFASAAALLLVALAYVPLLSGERDLENDFCVLLLLVTASSPTAWGHYFVLGFFPFCVFAARMLDRHTAVHLIALGLVFGFTLNLGDGVSLPAWLAARINAALPYSVLVACTYFPLYGLLALAAWFRSTRSIVDRQPSRLSTSG